MLTVTGYCNPPPSCSHVRAACCLPLRQSGRAKVESAAAAASETGNDGAAPPVIPLTSGRALTIGYLQALIDAGGVGGGEAGGGGREGEVTSALHDELAYLLMEGLLVRWKRKEGGARKGVGIVVSWRAPAWHAE